MLGDSWFLVSSQVWVRYIRLKVVKHIIQRDSQLGLKSHLQKSLYNFIQFDGGLWKQFFELKWFNKQELRYSRLAVLRYANTPQNNLLKVESLMTYGWNNSRIIVSHGFWDTSWWLLDKLNYIYWVDQLSFLLHQHQTLDG